MGCSIKGCTHEVYYDNLNTRHHQECIFHCEKDDWYYSQNEVKIWYPAKLIEFWTEFNKLDSVDFDEFIFPEFKHIDKKMAMTVDSHKEFVFAKLEKQNLTFENCIFEGKVEFDYLSFEEVSFVKCKFNDIASFSHSFFGRIKYFQCDFLQRLFIVDTQFNDSNSELLFKDSWFFKRLVIRRIKNSDNLRLTFDIAHFEQDSIIDIAEIQIGSLTFRSVYNNSRTFKIDNFVALKEIIFKDTIVDSIVFNKCDLEKANKLKLYNVSFNNVQFNNVDWGKIDQEHIDANRDVIRQLKHSNDQQGNYIQANKFYSLEMEKYGEEIKNSKNYMEKVIFFIGKNLSNFSQNWILPIFWFLFTFSLIYDYFIFKKFAFDSNIAISSVFISLAVFLTKLCLGVIITYRSTKKWFYITVSLLFFQIIIYFLIGWDGNYFEDYFWILNPINTGVVDKSDLYEKFGFIIFKLFTVLISYHLVTALRFHTRRK